MAINAFSLESNLMAWWDFESYSNSNVTSKVNDYILNCISYNFVDGAEGKGVVVNGTNGHMTAYSPQDEFGFADSAFSFTMWINLSFYPSENASLPQYYQTLVGKANAYIFEVTANEGLQLTIPRDLLSSLGDGGKRWRGFHTGIPAKQLFTLNHWYHVAVTYNHAEKEAHIYLDGTELPLAPRPNGIPVEFTTNKEPLCVGHNRGYNGQNFNGIIDEIRVYDTDITKSQIEVIYQLVADGENRRPLVSTTFLPEATQGKQYSFSLVGSDPDGDKLYWSLGSDAPEGMMINIQSGVLTWPEPKYKEGGYRFSVNLTDGDLDANVTLTLPIIPTLTIATQFPSQVNVDTLYRFKLELADTTGYGDIDWVLTDKPESMEVVGQTIVWMPTSNDIGTQHFEIVANSTKGQTKKRVNITVVKEGATYTAPRTVTSRNKPVHASYKTYSIMGRSISSQSFGRVSGLYIRRYDNDIVKASNIR
jgi:hypothetical protein